MKSSRSSCGVVAKSPDGRETTISVRRVAQRHAAEFQPSKAKARGIRAFIEGRCGLKLVDWSVNACSAMVSTLDMNSCFLPSPTAPERVAGMFSCFWRADTARMRHWTFSSSLRASLTPCGASSRGRRG